VRWDPRLREWRSEPLDRFLEAHHRSGILTGGERYEVDVAYARAVAREARRWEARRVVMVGLVAEGTGEWWGVPVFVGEEEKEERQKGRRRREERGEMGRKAEARKGRVRDGGRKGRERPTCGPGICFGRREFSGGLKDPLF